MEQNWGAGLIGLQAVSHWGATGPQAVSHWGATGLQAVSHWRATRPQAVSHWEPTGLQAVSHWGATGPQAVSHWGAGPTVIQYSLLGARGTIQEVISDRTRGSVNLPIQHPWVKLSCIRM